VRNVNPIDYPFIPDGLGSIENVIGSQSNDLIFGDQGDNKITGYLGDDTMKGSGGRDVFHFELSGGTNVGNDIIVDFEIGVDRISLGGGLHADLSDLNPQQVGADTLLDLGPGMRLTLQHVNAALLTNNDFIF
jgi:serralysin